MNLTFSKDRVLGLQILGVNKFDIFSAIHIFYHDCLIDNNTSSTISSPPLFQFIYIVEKLVVTCLEIILVPGSTWNTV